jgi:SAM-dependent methyltransferase
LCGTGRSETYPTTADWNDRYRTGDAPWDNNVPDSEMLSVLRQIAIAPCRMLELGCGTGTNAVQLALRGFDVTAFDVAPLAIEKAKARAAQAGVKINFFVGDVFKLPALGEAFPFVYDRGVYHTVRRQGAEQFCQVVAGLTKPGGLYLTLAGNANEENAPAGGPPRVTAEEICRELSPAFELVQLREFRFDPVMLNGRIDQPLAWSALWRRRSSVRGT